MGKRIILRRIPVIGSEGKEIGEIRYEVDSDMINTLLQIADADIGAGKSIDQCAKNPAHIPADKAGKRAKLKKFGYDDEMLDVLEKEGVI